MPFKVFPPARSKLAQSAATTLSAPQHFVPPTKRELRTQAIHRLQVGIFGLCAMLLLVGLANIIMNRARLAEAPSTAETSAGAGKAKTGVGDPLADIGVVPAADGSAAAAAPAKTP